MLITKNLLSSLSDEAKFNPRLRKNICLHQSQSAPAQIMINDFEVGTKIDIHKHNYTDETLIVLKGKLEIVYYNNNGDIQGSFILQESTDNFGILIPKEQYHWLNITESVTVLEIKDGPYRPLLKDEILCIEY